MKSIQHIMCDIYNNGGKGSVNAANLIYPDAIRGYGLSRQITHFERPSSLSPSNSDGRYTLDDVLGRVRKGSSYFKFPTSMKDFTADKAADYVKDNSYQAYTKSCVIGEATDISAFIQNNGHLDDDMFRGVLTHLNQDCVFDAFIRDKFDCTKKYNDTFFERDTQYDGKEFRKVIEDVEQHSVYVLAHNIYKSTGETIDQQWFEDNIFPGLREAYPEDLAEKTISFMKIDDVVNERIKNHDWSHIDDVVHGIGLAEFRSMHDMAGLPVEEKERSGSYSRMLSLLNKGQTAVNIDEPDLTP